MKKKGNSMMKKIQILIRFTVVLFIGQLLFSGNIFAQDSTSLVSASLAVNEELTPADSQIPLEQFLDELEQSYRVTFFYQAQVVEDKYVNSREIKLSQMTGKKLVKILTDLGLKYSQLDEETYVLYTKDSRRSLAQIKQYTVSGTVTDAQNNELLPGVNIIVKGTTIGTSTDVDGNYSLEAPSATDTLVFSFIGFQSQTVPIDERSEINVSLQPKAFQGEELVVEVMEHRWKER